MVAIEILVFVTGSFHLMRTLSRDSGNIELLLLSALLILSWIRVSNLARVGVPYFHGQFYGFADGLSLLAISCYLRSNYRLSSSMLILGFAIHPIKTLFGFVFIGAMHLHNLRSTAALRRVWPYAFFLTFGIAWIWLWLGFGKSENIMTADQFFRYAPLLNSHWFPQDLGLLGENHSKYTTAFLSSLLVSSAILIRSNLTYTVKIQVLLGLLAMVMLTICGIFNAWFEISATLVKVSPQRASVLVLGIAAILLVIQTVRDVFANDWWFAVLGLGIVAVPFFGKITWPVVLAVVYMGSTLCDKGYKQQVAYLWDTGLCLLISVLGFELFLWYAGSQESQFWKRQIILFLVSIISYFLVRLSVGLLRSPKWECLIEKGKYGLLGIVIIGSNSWAGTNRKLNAAVLNLAYDYRQIQDWARNQTASTNLFMPDPCSAYGWRDFSNRSSFGLLHEWYKSGWLYSGDESVLKEGLQRGKRLGVDLDLVVPHGQRSGPGWSCTMP